MGKNDYGLIRPFLHSFRPQHRHGVINCLCGGFYVVLSPFIPPFRVQQRLFNKICVGLVHDPPNEMGKIILHIVSSNLPLCMLLLSDPQSGHPGSRGSLITGGLALSLVWLTSDLVPPPQDPLHEAAFCQGAPAWGCLGLDGEWFRIWGGLSHAAAWGPGWAPQSRGLVDCQVSAPGMEGRPEREGQGPPHDGRGWGPARR
jgi:hypothetical protein